MASMNTLTKEDKTMAAPTVIGGMPDGTQQTLQQLRALKDGDTVAFMTTTGNMFSVRQTAGRLQISALSRKPCVEAQIAALALAGASIAFLIALLIANPFAVEFEVEGILVEADAIRGVIQLLEGGATAGAIAEFLVKYLCH